MDKNWEARFREVWEHGIEAWKQGRKSPTTMFTPEQVAFLASIGCTAQELFDFVDDHLRYGEPDFETTRAVTAIRRDYFLKALGGVPARMRATMESLPPKTAAVDGIAWLPRIIVKARLKLRGEMPDDLMYGCAGDRAFLREVNLTLPGFLELVRDQGDNDRGIIDAVKRAAGRA
ncbi:MAG: DUF5069 domain-containing protein [Verrucomicrobia bacterium]|jgi:hypothetical protein|nr:DUF5069 domain-containing protein [Verrucomicrobiota bacterium]